MTPVSPRQRAAAWLALFVAVLIAVTPSAGVMVCLGHDGHVGIGAKSEVGACTCSHEAHGKADAQVRTRTPDTGSERGVPTLDERLPPCTDVAVDPPDAFRTGDLGVSLPDASDGAPDDPHARSYDALAASLADELRSAEEVRACAARTARAALRPPSFLEHKRSIVLLI